MFKNLDKIYKKPQLFSAYTTQKMWDDDYVSKKMLDMHLNQEIDSASRSHDFIKNSALWITNEFALDETKTICDLGCGPGLYTEEFAKTGAKVTGIDFSKNSIAYAKKHAKDQNLKIDYIYQNYFEFESKEKFDLMVMIFCDFCVLNPKQRTQLLKKIASLLKDDGIFLFDVFTPSLFNKISENSIVEKNGMDKFWSNKPYYMFFNTFKYYEEKAFLDKYTIIKQDDSVLEIYNWIKCYTETEISKELKKAKLKVKKVYANVAGSPKKINSQEIALVVTKQ